MFQLNVYKRIQNVKLDQQQAPLTLTLFILRFDILLRCFRFRFVVRETQCAVYAHIYTMRRVYVFILCYFEIDDRLLFY